MKKWAEAAVISNGYQAVDALILYLVLPYHSLVFVDPHYFAGSKILKTLLHQGGFYPREAQFDFQLFRKQDFIGDPYAKSGFLLGELVRPERQNYEPIPYVLMLAIKHSLSIHCLLIKGSEKIPYATWLTPVRIEVSLIQSILPNKRLESTIAQYRFIITKMMDYERSRRSFKKERYPGSSYSTIPGQATPPRQSPDSNPPETEDQKDPEAE